MSAFSQRLPNPSLKPTPFATLRGQADDRAAIQGFR